MSPITTDHTNPQPPANQSLDALVCQLVNKLEAGEAVDLHVLAADHPEHLDHLQTLLPTLEAMASLGFAPDRENGSADGTAERSADLATGHRIGGNLGDFRILRELGRGADARRRLMAEYMYSYISCPLSYL